MPGYTLGDLVDLYRLQELIALFHRATGVSMGILDGDGQVLIACGWQEICTRFHREHPVTAERCRRSDEQIRTRLDESGLAEYRCGNGMWDIALPIRVAGHHLATVFLGQFFYADEVPDREYFRRQACELGFDVEEYLGALDRVPVFTRRRMDDITAYCRAFVEFLSEASFNTYATARELELKRHSQEELTYSLHLLNSLVNTIPNPIYFQDRAGAILGCNTAFAEQVVSLEPDKVVGHTLGNLPTGIPSLMTETFHRGDRELFDQPGHLAYEGRITCGDGQQRDFLFSKATFLGGSGEVAGILGVLVDITERKCVEENLQRAHEVAEAANRELARAIERATTLAAEADSANRAKDEFLATMSHELRTPLNGVIGMASMLEESLLDDDQRSHVRIIQNCGQVLLTLVNELLDYSRIEASNLDLQLLDFDLRVTLDELSSALMKRAREKHLKFLTLVSPRVPGLVRGDPGRLRQVLMHLVGNAIKFTDQGRIVVRVTLELETDLAVLVRFSVTDTGIGIPRDRLDQIFQAFTQIDGSSTRRHGGTGMGLALSKRLVEVQGGRIGVESEPEKGSTFWFTARFEKQPLDRQATVAPGANILGLRVLIVDDSLPSREIQTLQLERAGCRPEHAGSAEEALEFLRREARAGRDPVQMVITEKILPGMGGLELGSAIMADPGLGGPALILLTSQGRRGDATEAQESGFAAYLTKPIDRDLLIECLQMVVEQQSSPPEPDTALITRYTLEESRRRRVRLLVAESIDSYQRALLYALLRLGYSADCVADWEEAKEAVRIRAYDVIFMDCQMPPGRAVASADHLYRLLGLKDAPPNLVAMIASADESEDGRRVADLMDAQLARPVDVGCLAKVTQRLLEERTATREAPNAPPADDGREAA